MRTRGWFGVFGVLVGLATLLTPLPAHAAIGGSFSVNNVSVNEGGTASFTVTRALGVGSGKVDVFTSAVSAKRAIDFAVVKTTLSFGATETAKTVLVPTVQDDLDEKHETFKVNLANASGSTIEDATGIGTIADDDPSPTISVADVAIAEGSAGTKSMLFTVKLNKVSGQNVRARFKVVDGTATAAGSDFATLRGGVAVTAGNLTGTFAVIINGDKAKEANETFTVELSNPIEVVIGDGTATGTITNDD